MNHDELQQKLWEFVYDLLSEDEAREVSELITSDAEVARAYAEVRLQCDVLAEALRVPADEVPLVKPSSGAAPVLATIGPASKTSKTPRRSGSWGNRFAAAAAGILACALSLSLGGYGVLSYRASQLAGEPLVHTRVFAPPEVSARARHSVTVLTTDPGNSPVSTDVELSLRRLDDHSVMFKEVVTTDAAGKAVVDVPPQSAEDLELFVRTVDSPEGHAVRGRLHSINPLAVAHVETDRRHYAWDETAQARAIVLDRVTGKPMDGVDVQFDTEGAATAETIVRSESGVASAGIPLAQPDSAVEKLVIAAKSPSNLFEPTSDTVAIDPPAEKSVQLDVAFGRLKYRFGDEVFLDARVRTADGQPAPGAEVIVGASIDGQILAEPQVFQTNSNGQVKARIPAPASPGMDVVVSGRLSDSIDQQTLSVPVESSQAQVLFYPEGGHLVPNLPNRVYFQVLSEDQTPLEANGRVVDQQGQVVTQFSTLSELGVGRGLFEITPSLETVYRVELDQPAGMVALGDLSASAPDYFAVLQAEESVMEAHESVQMRVSSTRAPRTMVLVATCRGVEVGHTAIDVSQSAQPVEATVPLSPEADGAIRVTLFDYGSIPYRPIAERLVFRQPADRLQIDLVESAVTGDLHQYNVQVKNSRGEPVEATLGAAVLAMTPDELPDQSPGLVADFLLLNEASRASWEDVNAYVTNTPPADQQLEFFLGVQPWRYDQDPKTDVNQLAQSFGLEGRFQNQDQYHIQNIQEEAARASTVKPPNLLQNDDAIRARTAMIEELRVSAHRWIGVSGRIVILLSIVTLVVALFLAGMQRATARFWGTTLGFSATAFLLAALFVGEDILQDRRKGSEVAMAPRAPTEMISARSPAAPAASPPPRAPEYAEEASDREMRDFATDDAGLPKQANEFLVPGPVMDPPELVTDSALEPAASDAIAENAPADGSITLNQSVGGAGRSGGFGGGVESAQSSDLQDTINDQLSLQSAPAMRGFAGDAELRQRLQNRGGLRFRAESRSAQESLAESDATFFSESQLAAGILDPQAEAAARANPVLLWNPLLPVDSSGNITLDVAVPPHVSRWRLTITAHGEEGLGEYRREFRNTPSNLLAWYVPGRVSETDQFRPGTELAKQLSAAAPMRYRELERSRSRAAAEPAENVQTEGLELQSAAGPTRSVDTTRRERSFGWTDYYKQSALTITPDGYPFVAHVGGELRTSATSQLAITGYDGASPVRWTIRVYPSLASEILDAARAIVTSEPVMRASTYAALERAQEWMNVNNVPDVDLMRALNERLGQKADNNWHNELRANVESATGNYQRAIQAYLAILSNDAVSNALLSELASAQADDGHMPCDATFTGSGALAQKIEATAMSVLAWETHEAYLDNAQRARQWLRAHRSGDGGWATEEAQALALMALCTDTSRAILPPAETTLRFTLTQFNQEIAVPADSPEPVILTVSFVPNNPETIEFTVQGPDDQPMSYAAMASYAGNQPAPPENSNLRISTSLDRTTAKVGELVQMKVTVEGRAEPMVAVRIPIPAGMQLVDEPLPEKYGWEDGDLMLYFDSPFEEPKEWAQKEELLESFLPLMATHAGSFTAPAARVYPAHAPDQAVWAAPLKMEVQP